MPATSATSPHSYAHARQRARDHYRMTLSVDEVQRLADDIREESDTVIVLGPANGGAFKVAVRCRGRWLSVVWNPAGRHIPTVLPPDTLRMHGAKLRRWEAKWERQAAHG